MRAESFAVIYVIPPQHHAIVVFEQCVELFDP
jgi:hypothetical protein